MTTDNGSRGQSRFQQALVVILNDFGMPLQILDCAIPFLEERNDTFLNVHGVSSVSGFPYFASHHSQPFPDKVRKKNGSLVAARVRRFCRICSNPAKINCIPKASGQRFMIENQFIRCGIVIRACMLKKTFDFFCGQCWEHDRVLFEIRNDNSFDSIGIASIFFGRHSRRFVFQPLQ